MKGKNPKSPPKLATWLLGKLCRKEYLDEVQGDLLEVFEWRAQKKGVLFAQLWYLADVISALRLFKPTKSKPRAFNGLLLSFVKSSFRNFRRHWSYSLLNLLGLSSGIAIALLIMQHVSDELDYDQFSQAETMYRVENNYIRFGQTIYESAMTFSGVAPAMIKELPEVEVAARLYNVSEDRGGANIISSLENPSINYQEPATYFGDHEMVDLFDISLVSGVNGLAAPNTVLITESYAEKLFGSSTAALGQTIRYSNVRFTKDLEVVGIMKVPDFNMQVSLKVLISYATLYSLEGGEEDYSNDWGNYSFLTYVRLRSDADPKAIEEKMSSITLKYKQGYTEKDENGQYLRVNSYFLTPVKDVHLNSTYQNEVGGVGDSTAIQMLIIITVFILIIAWVNYINLSTARSLDRAKEVGLRKVLGAQMNELIGQFFTEAFLLNLMALLIALGSLLLLQPSYNNFIEKELSLGSIDWGKYGGFAAIIFCVGTLLSGLYPAIIIARYKTLDAFKKKLSVTTSGVSLRQALVVFQLLITSVLIIGTYAIKEQIDFMKSRTLGFDKEQILILKNPTIRNGSSLEERVDDIQLFKERVAAIPGVGAVGTTTEIPGSGILRGIAISTVSESEEHMHAIERVLVDNHFLDILNVNFVAGSNFDPERGYSSTPIILNISAAKEMGFLDLKGAIGKTIYEFTREPREIVGIIEDYHHESLNRPKDPMYFVRSEAFDSYYALDLNSHQVQKIVKDVERVFGEVFPGNPPEYFFLDSHFDGQYRSDELNSKVFTVFALLAIMVACLGLYGLSSFATSQRAKEMGIRKVLGARVFAIFFLLTREILMLTFLGFALALPLAYYGINRWLNSFAFHIDISSFLFFIPMILVLGVALLAVSQKIIKTAITNPIESLRYE